MKIFNKWKNIKENYKICLINSNNLKNKRRKFKLKKINSVI